MKRSTLEQYLNQRLTVTLCDGTVCTGVLEQGNGLLPLPKWYYLRGSCRAFRSSHVKKVYLKRGG